LIPPDLMKRVLSSIVWRYLLAAVLASTVVACASEGRGITEPTPPSTEPTPPSGAFVHNTLNPPDNRSFLEIKGSWRYSTYFPMLDTLAPWTWDDFTSAETATIRTVSWQGGYCQRRGLAPISATAISFDVSFYPDGNGRPQYFGTSLYAARFTPAEAREQFAFDSSWNELDCAYYDYTAILPTPFPVTAGTRYWLLIMAEIGSTGPSWGWRLGGQDNGISARGTLKGGIFTSPSDLAFSLSNR